MKKTLLILFVLAGTLFNSSSYNKDKINDSITVIKFMYSVNDYSIAIYEKSFWYYPEEHAKLQMSIEENGNFLNEIIKMPSQNGETFGLLKYAFIINEENKTDTIYADSDLKTFRILNKNGSGTDYYDNEGFYAEQLRHKFSFFKDCW